MTIRLKIPRILSLFLSLVFVLSLFPSTALANTGKTVFFENTDGWTTVNIYYWSDSCYDFVSWPGAAMTLYKDNIYSFTLPEDVTVVIFNNGKEQTPDLYLPDQQNFYHYDSHSWDIQCIHTFDDVVETPVTCTVDGTKTATCTSCGYSSVEIIPATGHSSVDGWIVTLAPTCTTDGSRYIECTVCQTICTEVLPASHQYVDNTCSICGVSAVIDSGNCGNNTWWTLDVFGTLSITGSGKTYGSSIMPWEEYYQDIQTVIVHSGITGIGDWAFNDCYNMTSITLPESVTSIGEGAFRRCSSLTTISLPAGVTSIGGSAFSGCSSLTTISLPAGVTSIGGSAFSGCSSLTTISLPAGVTSIGESAFSGCSGLTTISLPAGVTSIGESAFYGCSSLTDVTIPKGVFSIEDWTFHGCTRLASVTIADGVTGIGGYAFYGCSRLTSITIPDSVTNIGDRAFYCCGSLTAVTIGESVVSIGDYAFFQCNNLAAVTIGESVASIGDYAFYECCNLTAVSIPGSVTTIGKRAFKGCDGLASLTISEGVTTIGESAFCYCSNLSNITLPDSVISIGDYAFESCQRLTAVTIGKGITDIGEYAFSWCFRLTDIVIPESVTSIGENAFTWCIGLTSIDFLGSAPTIGADCFTGVTAIAYHPCADDTWTEEVKSNYNGTLTWVGHLISDMVYNQDATCTNDGTQTGYCPSCGEEETLTAPNTALGHSYVNGICGICGTVDPDYVQPVIQPTLTLKSPTLEFKDMITVNAMFTAENIEDVVEMGMITYTEKVDVWNVETAAHVIPGTAYDAATGRYIAHSQGINAKYLGDTVYLACYAKLSDGSFIYTKLAPYSPVQYATNQLKNSSDMKLKQLVAAMLNYGAQAQLFFGHNTDNLANATLTDEQKTLPEAYRSEMVSAVPTASAEKQGIFANNKGFAKRYPSISFEGAFCINYFFKPNYAPVGDITLYYWNESDFNAAEVLTKENASGSLTLSLEDSGEYRGDIEGIAAKNLSASVFVAAVYSDGTTEWTSGVLGYSIGAYCGSQISKGADVAALAEATAVYGYHAKAYFG